jgi:exosortase
MSTHTISEAAPKTRPVAPAEAPPAPVADVPDPSTETPPAWKWLLLLLPLAALAPLLTAHASHLWTLPHYQFFPFVVFGAVVLAWSRWGSAPRGANDLRTAFALLVGAWLVLALGETVNSPMLAVVALQMILAAGLFALGGSVLFRALLPAWAFLWILVPLPFGLDRLLVSSMQNVASKASSAVLDCFGVIHVLDGNVVRVAQKPLFVEEACAGLSSLFTLVACSLFLVLWLRRPLGRAILLMVSSVGWVLACNILRIVTIAFCLDAFGPEWDLSKEPRHSILGFGCFCLAVLLIWSTDRFFLFFLPSWNNEEPAPSAAPAASDQAVQPVVPKTVRLADLCRLASAPLAAAFCVVLVMHFAIHSFILPDPVAPPGFDDKIQQIGEKSLPAAIDGYVKKAYGTDRRDTGSAFGEYSKVWVYRKGVDTHLLISLDYPFPKFHDLAPCYVGRGWNVESSNTTQELNPNPKNAPEFWHELRLWKEGGRFGYVVFAEFNAEGDALTGESRLLGSLQRNERALQAIYDRIFRPEEFKAPKPLGPAYQIQALIEADEPIQEKERTELQRVFLAASRDLRAQLFDGKPK